MPRMFFFFSLSFVSKWCCKITFFMCSGKIWISCPLSCLNLTCTFLPERCIQLAKKAGRMKTVYFSYITVSDWQPCIANTWIKDCFSFQTCTMCLWQSIKLRCVLCESQALSVTPVQRHRANTSTLGLILLRRISFRNETISCFGHSIEQFPCEEASDLKSYFW